MSVGASSPSHEPPVVRMRARWPMTQRAGWSDAGACDPGHRRRGAGRLDHDGLQRLQPAREALGRAARADPGQGRRARLRRAERARALAAAPGTGVLGVVLGEALTYAFEDPATVEFFRGLASAGIALRSCPRPVPRATRRWCWTPPSTPSSLYAAAGRASARGRGARQQLPIVVQSGPQLDGHPFVAIDERAAAAARPTTCGRSGIRGWRCSRCRSRCRTAPTAAARRGARPPRRPRRLAGLRRHRGARGAEQRPRARRGGGRRPAGRGRRPRACCA